MTRRNRQVTGRRAQAACIMLGAALLTANVAQGQYTWVQDTDNAGAWDDPARWLDGGSNTTYPNAPDATVVIATPPGLGTAVYALDLPATDTTVGDFTIDNTNHPNNFRTNFRNTGGKLIFQSNSGPATFTETVGSAPGGTNTQVQVMPIIDVLSDLVITQNNYPNLNSGTIFTNLVNGASNLTITKEGFGGIQFNYNALPLFEDEGFEGQYVINQGGIRLIGRGAIDKSSGVTVNAGGQLQLADNAGTTITDWNLAPGASLKLNGSGKALLEGTSIASPEGALRIAITANRSTAFHNPVLLQSDSVISVTTATTTGTLDAIVSGPGGLTKHGGGTLILNNSGNSYEGDTTVLAGGPLSITNPFLANGADVYLTTGGVFDLSFSDTDVIRSLFIDGVAQPTGVWGATGGSALNQTDLITGSGLLQVTEQPADFLAADFDNSGAVDGADFITWKNGFGSASGQAKVNGDADEDADVDGADFLVWQSQFGSPGAVASVGTVPEPAAALLALAAAPLATFIRRKRSPHHRAAERGR